MTKKIEIHSQTAQHQVYISYDLLKGNSLSTAGPSKAYLMSGTVPFNSIGLVPWGYDVVIDPENGELPTDPVTNPPRAVTPGTYTGSSDHYGLGLTSAITLTVAENNQINLQVELTGEMPLTSGLASTFLTTTGFGLNVNWDTVGSFQEPITITAKLYDPANLLVTWNNKRLVTNNNNISTNAAPATASGIATWFFIKNGEAMIAGTVGLTGSGADLELDDVNIVQGKTYGINNLRFQVPTSFTYLSPTYAVASAANSVDEGSPLTFTVTTTNLPSPTTLYWVVLTNAGDFATSSGTVTINSNTGSFSVTPTSDTITEVDAETFTVGIRTSALSESNVATSDPITINDTSRTPS